MSMSDKRSVATDALETLGTVIDDKQKRDAIHLAVIPMKAGNFLHAGQHVEVHKGHAVGTAIGKGVGIVDPFLTAVVDPGQWFWLVLYPRTIQSLRHVWAHPAFPDEPRDTDEPTPAAIEELRKLQSRANSERWLIEFCARSNCPSYEEVIGVIMSDYLDGESLHFGNDASGEIPDVFWDHVEVVLGRKVANRPTYFSCAC